MGRAVPGQYKHLSYNLVPLFTFLTLRLLALWFAFSLSVKQGVRLSNPQGLASLRVQNLKDPIDLDCPKQQPPPYDAIKCRTIKILKTKVPSFDWSHFKGSIAPQTSNVSIITESSTGQQSDLAWGLLSHITGVQILPSPLISQTTWTNYFSGLQFLSSACGIQ